MLGSHQKYSHLGEKEGAERERRLPNKSLREEEDGKGHGRMRRISKHTEWDQVESEETTRHGRATYETVSHPI